MKKIMSLLLVLFATFALVACGTETDETSSNPISSSNPMSSEPLENEAFIEIVDANGSTSSVTLHLLDDEEIVLFDAVTEHFNVTYDTYDFGHMLTSIRSKDGSVELVSKPGSFISIQVDGESASSGVDGVMVKGEMTVSLVIEWYDDLLKEVESTIQNFLKHQVVNYTSETLIDPHVVSALSYLGVLENYLTLEEAEAFYGSTDLTKTSALYKAIVVLSHLKGNPTDVDGKNFIQAVINNAALDQWTAPYALIALNSYDHDLDVSAYEQQLLEVLKTTAKPSQDFGLDMSGIALASLAPYRDEEHFVSIIGDYKTFLSTNQNAQGGISDTQWGLGENASSISQVITGLLSVGIDPRGEEFTKSEGGLIRRLLDFSNEDGSFNYLLEDEDADLAFSTPQAFLTLVLYQTYCETYEAVPFYMPQ